MLANELSKLTGTNIETIRMYRKKGFLKPTQDKENGYYHYSDSDVYVLMHLQLLRAQNISLAEIHRVFQSGDSVEIQKHLDDQIKALQDEITALERRLNILLSTKNHISNTPTNSIVKCIQVSDEKYDYYSTRQLPEVKRLCVKSLIPYSIVLGFDCARLNETLVPEMLPLKSGIGIYRSDFQNGKVTPPPDGELVPTGAYLTAMISLRQFDAIDTSQLLSLRDYAREHRLLFTGKTTAYITHIDYSGSEPIFYFRLRAQVVDGEQLAAKVEP